MARINTAAHLHQSKLTQDEYLTLLLDAFENQTQGDRRGTSRANSKRTGKGTEDLKDPPQETLAQALVSLKLSLEERDDRATRNKRLDHARDTVMLELLEDEA